MGKADELAGTPLTAEQSVGHNIFVLSNIVAGGYYERAERPFGLSLAQWTVLRTVLISPESSQADVAAACGLNVMNVSRAVAALRAKGLVEATDDPRNQRRKMLTATPIGEAIGGDLAERERLLYDHVFDGLPADEVERVDAAINQVISRLAEHPPPEPPAPSRDWRAVLAGTQASPSSTKRTHQTSGAQT
jgi:DNA-binding MarR family transcriptional regulator